MMCGLDEAQESVSSDKFGSIYGSVFDVKAEEVQLGFRNFKQPLFLMKKVELATILISAELKIPMDSEFYLHYMETLFHKYKMPAKLNKLINKSYYDANIKID